MEFQSIEEGASAPGRTKGRSVSLLKKDRVAKSCEYIPRSPIIRLIIKFCVIADSCLSELFQEASGPPGRLEVNHNYAGRDGRWTIQKKHLHSWTVKMQN